MENTFEHMVFPMTTITSGVGIDVTPDLFCLPIQVVNVCFFGEAEKDGWVLIDAGMPRSADKIIEEGERRYGQGSKPAAIILTHGHFDHVGAIVELVEQWGVPVYAHQAEMPYLTGQQDYPEADPTVGGGLVTEMSPMFPNQGINLDQHVQPLPADGSVPRMPGWRWIHTPGHTPGHISLFRDEDRALIVGDAFITVKQESLWKVLTQAKELNGPPAYFTTDWQAAWDSVKKLAALQPSVAITGHGLPMIGAELVEGLERLAEEFGETEIPEHGRFVQ